VGNSDDHARNNAFFVIDNKIELTPAYDICQEAQLSQASKNVLWKRAILNNNIFYGGCKHLMPKE